MSDLIYSAGKIFSTDTEDGVLGMYNATKYYIAPYQRGYKWASEQPNDSVCILMKDLFEAYSSDSPEYYLQYITTAENSHLGHIVLEVIDGQQRLTTLTLLFAVLRFLTNDESQDAARFKLSYQVRENVSLFFSGFIYGDIGSIIDLSWDEFIKKYPDFDEQDISYLFHALKRICSDISAHPENKADFVMGFSKFIRDKVKIILNNVKSNISCEKIFANLNTNKIDLTGAELIKGLLLTRTAREKTPRVGQQNYKEILEIRAVIGRQWDEISGWTKRPEICSFYFGDTDDALEELLIVLGRKHGYVIPEKADKYALYNYFQSQIKTEKHTAKQYFSELKKLYGILSDWFNDPIIYNCLGFLFFSKDSNAVIGDYIDELEKPKDEVRKFFKKKASDLIFDDLTKLDYSDSDTAIHRVLLALSVFDGDKKFDFETFASESWSLEHIFPQNPKKLSENLGPEDIKMIMSLAGDRLDDKEKLKERHGKLFTSALFNSVRSKLAKDHCTLSDDEKRFIYMIIKTDKLNSIGNMALLTGSDNSSNKNGMFDKKRNNIVKLISEGSFVPKHTYDVFSKLISENMVADLKVWSEKDIAAHQKWMIERISKIKQINLAK